MLRRIRLFFVIIVPLLSVSGNPVVWGQTVTNETLSSNVAQINHARFLAQSSDRNSYAPPVPPQGDILALAGYIGVAAESYTYEISTNKMDLFRIYMPAVVRNDLTTTLFVQNITSNEVYVFVSFYSTGGTNVLSLINTIPAHGSRTYSQELSALPSGFEGNAVVSSDGPILGVANIEKTGTNSLLSYNATIYGSTTIVLPRILRNWNGWNTDFWVQNVGSGSANITMTYTPTSGGNSYTTTDTIPGVTSHVYRQADMSALGNSFSGWVSITSDQDVTVVVEEWDSTSDKAGAYNALPYQDDSVLLPLQQKNVDGWSTGVYILNTGTENSSLTNQYYSQNGTLVWSDSATVGAGNAIDVYLIDNSNLADGYDGALAITASQPVFILDTFYNPSLSGSDSYGLNPGIPQIDIYNRVQFPRIAHIEAEGVSTQFSIQNAAQSSATASVTITYYDQGGTVTAVVNDVIPYQGVSRYYTEEVSELGTSWEGSVSVQSDQPIVGEATQIKRDTSTEPKYTISGRVTDAGSNPISGVTISDGVGQTTTTDSSGSYTLTGLTTGTYTITPSKSGYNFSPASRTVSVPPDALNQNFTGTSGPDFTVTAIEVTQAVQDIYNSVPLIAGKRTYARVHVRNLGLPSSTFVTARLCRLSWCLSPDNPGGRIQILTYPNRTELDQGFYFELPPGWLNGSITLKAEVNPSGSQFVEETNTENNLLSQSITFDIVPPVRIKLFGVKYRTWPLLWQVHEPRQVDYDLIISWLRRAYPTAEVLWSKETIDLGVGLPTCAEVNERLLGHWSFDRISGKIDKETRYYGIVYDSGGFMRGCSSLPGTVGSGPTGIPDNYFTWDNDVSYGDWYAAHELAHSYGRYHAEFCGARYGKPYPYPNGIIGGYATNTSRFYGFDVQTKKIYIPTGWHDVMTYCEYQWISDFTYKGLRDYLLAHGTQSAQSETSVGEHLIVSGLVNFTQNTAELHTLYRIPDVVGPSPPSSGTHHLKLLGANNVVLADYPFTPRKDTDTPSTEDVIGLIGETVPWIPGTKHVAVYSGTLQLATRSVSANTPSINLLSPNGGEVFTDTVMVSWEASDADQDPLSYVIQYSADDGTTWQAVAIEISNTTVYTRDLSLLPGCDQCRLRVIASDGINTVSDTSDGSFSVSRKPPRASILSPSSGISFLPGQTVILIGEGTDVEDGTLTDAALSWQSNLSGELGTGRMLDVTGLIPGAHIITLKAADSDGNIITETINIFIGHRVYLPLSLK